MWLKAQVAILAAGTLFTGITVAADFYRYLLIGGDLAQFDGAPLANPLATPCFYGAMGFAVALVWAVRQLGHQSAQVQVPLTWLLLAGTLLGLVSVGYQCYVAGAASCVGTVLDPLDAPCAAGSVLYLAGLGTAMAARRSLLRRPPPAVADDRPLPAHHRVP